MNTKQKQISIIDSMLATPGIEKQAKTLLLLKICQITQVMQPEVFFHYLPILQSMAKHLPDGYKRDLKDITKTDEPEKNKKSSGFANQIAPCVRIDVASIEKSKPGALR